MPLTLTTIPLGMCLSTTQLLVLLVACPPGPEPLTNCSSKSSSLRLGRSIRSFFPAVNTLGSPTGRDLRRADKQMGVLLHTCITDTLHMRLKNGKPRDIFLNTCENALWKSVQNYSPETHYIPHESFHVCCCLLLLGVVVSGRLDALQHIAASNRSDRDCTRVIFFFLQTSESRTAFTARLVFQWDSEISSCDIICRLLFNCCIHPLLLPCALAAFQMYSTCFTVCHSLQAPQSPT